MNELDNIISQYRSVFDSEIPMEGDFRRFLTRMEKSEKAPVWRLYKRGIGVAAAVAVLLGIGIAWGFYTPEREMVRVYERYCHEVAKITAELQMSVNVSEIGTLNEIIENISNESIPLMSLLPDEMRASEKLAIMKGYYQDKLNGILELRTIVKSR
ncbi:MAG: hypothetical protein IKW65_02215 [Bacteroidales bacterium]|nr:hypothetical protein [Bacteroidales bacterium]